MIDGGQTTPTAASRLGILIQPPSSCHRACHNHLIRKTVDDLAEMRSDSLAIVVDPAPEVEMKETIAPPATLEDHPRPP